MTPPSAAAPGDLAEAHRPISKWLGARALAALAVFVLALVGGPPATAQTPAPVVCKIGMNVEDLYDLDTGRDTFGAVLWIWSLCPSGDLEPLGAIAFPTAQTGLNLSPVETVDTDTGEQYASRRVQGTFRYNWDMTRYPFDRQRLTIPIDETRYGADRLTFEPDLRESFLTPDIRDRLDEWRIAELELSGTTSEEQSTYGVPNIAESRYARLEAAIPLERASLVTFLKLTSGVFVGVFIAFLSFFYDPSDRGGFSGKVGLLIGVLFAVLLNLRGADASIGDTGHLTLVTQIHLVTLFVVVALALVALRDRRRVERGLTVPHPDWRGLTVVGGLYVLVIAGLILRAALSL